MRSKEIVAKGINARLGRALRVGGAGIITLTMEGLTDGEARPGDHASISVAFPSGVTAWTSQEWGLNTYGDSAYGTGANPTTYTAGDGGLLVWEGLGDDGNTYRAAALIRYAAAVNSVAPVVSGSLTLGATLTVADGTWTATGGAYTRQWRRNGVNIGGATGTTYDIVAADSAAEIDCVVTYTNSGGAVSAASNAVTVQTFAAPGITGVPTISGTAQENEELTATPATTSGNPTPSRTWQWERSGTPISGATASTYTLVTADVGNTITVVQTETNALGVATAESAATGTVIEAVAAVNPSLTLTGQTAGSGGNPDTVTATFSYAGTDTLDLYAATGATAFSISEAQLIAGAGGAGVEFDSILGYTGGSIDLDGFTDDTVDEVAIVVVERNNGGSSGIQRQALTNIDFTPLALVSAETDAIDGTQVILTFNDTVLGSEVTGNWTVPGHTVTNVAIASPVVTLTVTPAIANGDSDTVSYSGGNLTDERGNALAAFSGQAVTNNVPAPSSGITVVETHSDTAASSSVTTTISLGTLQENDRVLVIRASDIPGALNAISGYSSIYNGEINAVVGVAIEEKKMGSTPDTEVVVPVNVSGSANYREAVAIYVLRGVDTTTFSDATRTVNTSGATANTIAPPAITTVTDGAMVIGIMFKDDDHTATDGTLPSGYSSKVFAQALAISATSANILAGVKVVETAGTETPGTFTMDGAADQVVAITLAVRPA